LEKVTEDFGPSAIGKNFKSIHEKLEAKEVMKVGSKVKITGGKHEGLRAKVMAISETDENRKRKMMGEEVKESGSSLISVELEPSGSV
jgi:hypothetical protein